MDKAKLAQLLRLAEQAHATYEKQLGHSDPDWPTFYASYIVDNLFPTPAQNQHIRDMHYYGPDDRDPNIQHIREDIEQDNDNADE